MRLWMRNAIRREVVLVVDSAINKSAGANARQHIKERSSRTKWPPTSRLRRAPMRQPRPPLFALFVALEIRGHVV
jgi:hypothetical protein